MKASRDLVLLTAAFPFGNKSETFLESEIEVLARRFGRIFILPSHREPGVRALPPNVEVVEMAWLEEPTTGRKVGALMSLDALRVVVQTLAVPGNVGPYVRNARLYLDLLARNILKARQLRKWIVATGLSGAVVYDYWFENSTLALAMLRKNGVLGAAACRAHGFDLYDERWQGGVVPFREAKIAGLDLVAPVSEYGVRYLKDKLRAHRDRVRLFRLGVRRQPRAEAPAVEGAPLVVSCGSLLPTKRVAVIPEVLSALGRPLRWVHFGDGPERPAVERAARSLPADVSWELKGHVDNAEVLRFYRQHHVHAMLSVSTSEGLPVSMMEAISFGVPVVAVGVHGVPELVNPVTGALLSPDDTVAEVAAALGGVLEGEALDRDRIRGYFDEHFEAEKNYDRFADALLALP